jgi:hypothetical protein
VEDDVLKVFFNSQGVIHSNLFWRSIMSARPYTEIFFAIHKKLCAVNTLIFGNLVTGCSTMAMLYFMSFFWYKSI